MLKKRTYPMLLALLALAASSPIALRSAPPQPIIAPGTVPSRIILTWTGDPARTQAVTWRTQVAVDSPQAQVAKLDADPTFEKGASTVMATAAQDDLAEGKTATHYTANFQGLQPNARYCYRVGDGKAWSAWNVFRTASDKAEPFRFLYIGDAQNKIASLCPRTMRMAYAAAPDARFIVHAGDLVAEGFDDKLWDEWSEAFGFITAMVPSLPVVGNHDLHHPAGDRDLKTVFSATPLWRHHFALPANGPDLEDMPSQSYYLDYQGVRFIALDTNVFASESDQIDPELKKRVAGKELEWLTKVLADNPNRWTIVTQHQGIYAVTKGRNYSEMRATLAPLYEKYHVDLVLQGHDHVYSRSHKIAGDRIVDPSAPGVIYAISVSGPKMYKLEPRHSELMAKQIEQKQFFQVIEVSPDKLKFTAYSIDNVVADAFELRKNGNGTFYANQAPGGGEKAYRIEARYPVAGAGGWDYITVDSAARRIYASHGAEVNVLDADTGRAVGVIADTPGVHGAAIARELGFGFTSNGKENKVSQFDTATLKLIRKIDVGKGPDGIFFDAGSSRIFTNNHGSHDISAIDAATGQLVGTIAVGGDGEQMVAGRDGMLYVNLEDTSEVVSFDPRTLRVARRFPIGAGKTPTGLAIDLKNNRLFIGCRSKSLVVMDAASGKVIASFPIGAGVDAVEFDPESRFVFASNGDGTLSIIHQRSADEYEDAGVVTTQPGAKTMAFDTVSIDSRII